MKRSFVSILLLVCGVLAALPPHFLPGSKMLHPETHSAGSLRLEVNNFGWCRDLSYATLSGDKLLSIGSIWIGGKLQRRDAEGRKLFWLAHNPSADSSGTTFEGAPDWHPGLKAVVDTLSSVGCDIVAGYGGYYGDVLELLPAYNPLAASADIYPEYNAQDIVLKSILGFPAPRDFAWPDPLGTYCFSQPQPANFATPGFETLSGFFYDFCPLGTSGQRDLGTFRQYNQHYPLGIAVKRESYAWNLQNLDRMLVCKNTIYNTSVQDSIFDLALGEFADADIYPAGQTEFGMNDDLSGCDSGYDFAYSRDNDGDGGLSPNWLGNKLILPGFEAGRSCWAWRLNFSPNDSDARSLNYAPHPTANEKYWLLTGRSIDPAYCYPLHSDGDELTEEPMWGDTRFLNCLCGAQPTSADPDPNGRLHLAPGDSLSYYSVYFVGAGLDDLRAQSQFIEDFIAGGLEIGPTSGLTCIPYLTDFQVVDGQVARLDWHSYTDPHHFELKCKPWDAPASQWSVKELPAQNRSVWIWDLDPNLWYQIKLAAVYEPGHHEVYLESETLLTSLGLGSQPGSEVPPVDLSLASFPNPFSEKTLVSFSVMATGPASLRVFNSRGQLVRELFSDQVGRGTFQKLWDGRDVRGSSCAAGIYFLRLESGGTSLTRKIAFIK